MSGTGLSRRRTLTSAATVGLGVPLLAACADDRPTKTADPGRPIDRSSTPDGPRSATHSSDESSKGGGGAGIASTAEIPVGSGVIVATDKVVITQPSKGVFKAFTAICTHQGCTVNQVTDTINCPCHQSRFSIETGEPVAGPAPSALAGIELTVRGDSITLA